MIRTKLSSLFVVLLFLNGFLYSQETKDYKQEYNDLTKGITDEQEYHETTSEYFNSMDNDELPLALADISKEENTNYVAYKLFAPNNARFEDKDFRENMFKQLSEKSNSYDFKMVLIDFISELAGQDDEQREKFNQILFTLAKNKESATNLRSYAASHSGISKNYETDKEQLTELFESDNYGAVNGAARSIKKFLFSDKISTTETDYWTDILINVTNKNINNLSEVRAVIGSLGSTGTNKARSYLLELFKNNAPSNSEVSETLAYSLSNIANTKVLNTIFAEYSKHEHFNNFGSELTLKEIVSNNNDVVDKLYNEKNEESKLTFLRAVRLMKDENRSKYLEKVKQSLRSDSETERLESVKTLHFLLPYEEEVKLFNEHIAKEENENVKNLIYSYVGE